MTGHLATPAGDPVDILRRHLSLRVLRVLAGALERAQRQGQEVPVVIVTRHNRTAKVRIGAPRPAGEEFE